MEKKLKLFVVDAFTSVPFKGNPAGVCILASGSTLTKDQMVTIAIEMKHAVTAFVWRLDESNVGNYGLRWFTPISELDLCVEAKHAEPIDFKAQMSAIGSALSLDPTKVIATFREPQSGKLFLEVSGFLPISTIVLNADALISIPYPANVCGCYVFTTNLTGSVIDGKGFDVASRYFVPWVGVPEDPVNGSGSAILGTLLSRRTGKKEFKAFMASSRTGKIAIEVLSESRVAIKGEARTIINGEIFAPNSE
jgi:predicted PhzF superfamily epimerase YddE/YHI9